MKHLNSQINNNSSRETEEAKYLMMLCQERSDIVIKTEYGIGNYKFVKLNELQGNLVLEFQLLKDNKFKDISSIHNNIGNTCFLSIHQYLYVYSSACA